MNFWVTKFIILVGFSWARERNKAFSKALTRGVKKVRYKVFAKPEFWDSVPA